MNKVHITRLVHEQFKGILEEVGLEEVVESASGTAEVSYVVEIEGGAESEHGTLNEVADECLDLFKRGYHDFYAFPITKDTDLNPDLIPVLPEEYPITPRYVSYIQEKVNEQLSGEQFELKTKPD